MKSLIPLLLLAFCGLTPAQALNLKDVPDDARATVLKELARQRLQASHQADGVMTGESVFGTGSSGKKNNDCKLDVGSNTRPTQPGGRNTTTVITGSVVQICGR